MYFSCKLENTRSFIFNLSSSGTECPPLRRRMGSRSKGPATWTSNAPFCSCSTTRYHPRAGNTSYDSLPFSSHTVIPAYCSLFQPPQYKLDPRLARLLGVHTQTRASIMQALWLYIKNNKLQDCHEKEYINCNRYFRQVMNWVAAANCNTQAHHKYNLTIKHLTQFL